MSCYYVYVLRSDVDGRLYKGHTTRLEERIGEHNFGKTSSTKGYRPWKLVYFEKLDSLKDAVDRERFLKSGAGREFLNTKLRPRGATE